MPVYNEADYIAACLDAIAAQTVAPNEVIVVDNNSTDATRAIAARYPFVTVISEPRQGVRFAHRTGMDAATGDIIGRIDADTALSPGWCEQLRESFADGDIAAVTGACFYYDMPFQRFGLWADRMMRRVAQRRNEVILYGSNMAIRRSAWQRISSSVCLVRGIFEDCDMAIHLREQRLTVVYDPKLVAGVSARTLDLSQRKFLQYMKNYNRTFKRHAIRSKAAARAKAIYLFFYPYLKLLRKMYNPETQRLSVLHLILGHNGEPRPSATE